jgi:hypothetical protein
LEAGAVDELDARSPGMRDVRDVGDKSKMTPVLVLAGEEWASTQLHLKVSNDCERPTAGLVLELDSVPIPGSIGQAGE